MEEELNLQEGEQNPETPNPEQPNPEQPIEHEGDPESDTPQETSQGTETPQEQSPQGETSDTGAEDYAPAYVTDRRPDAAKYWKYIPQEERERLITEIAEEMESGSADSGRGRAEGQTDINRQTEVTPSEGHEAQPQDKARESEQPTPALDISEEELQALTDDGLSDGTVNLIKKLSKYTQEVGQNALKAVEAQGKELYTLKDDREFESALINRGSELRGLDESAYSTVCNKARELKSQGRVRSWSDAVDYAIIKQGQNKPKPKAKTDEARRLASSIAGGKTTAGAAEEIDPNISPQEAVDRAAKKLGIA